MITRIVITRKHVNVAVTLAFDGEALHGMGLLLRIAEVAKEARFFAGDAALHPDEAVLGGEAAVELVRVEVERRGDARGRVAERRFLRRCTVDAA